VRDGAALREVARRHGVSLRTVQRWVARAGDLPLNAVDWRDRPSTRHRSSRTEASTEEIVLDVRRRLREESALGEYGAAAIRREVAASGALIEPVPSVRTIGRILLRHGALDPRRRRHPAPPPGWYLADVAARQVELDLFDVIEGTLLVDDRPLDVLTGISLHGGLASAWPTHILRAGHVEARLHGRWRESGRPAYAQFDNAARFVGGASVPDSIGDVIRFCLALGVVPVFAPPKGAGLPGRHRELQRALAAQGLGAPFPCPARGACGCLRPLHRGQPAPPRRPDRRRAAPPAPPA